MAFVRLRGKCVDTAAIRKNLKWLVLSGISLGLNRVCLFAAYMHTTVAVAGLFYYLAPVIVVAIAPLFYREKLGWKSFFA